MSESRGIQAAEGPEKAGVVVVGDGAPGLFLADGFVNRSPGSAVVVRTAVPGRRRGQGGWRDDGPLGEATSETLRTHAAS